MANRYCNGLLHVVRQGDTLYQLSRMYRIPLAMILRANPYVDVYNLQVGQEICIPVGEGRPNIPEMPGRPNMPEMGRPGMPTPPNMPEAPVMPEISVMPGAPNMPMMPEGDNNRIVYITDGEITLGELLNEYNISLEDFAKMNDLSQVLLAKDVVLYLPKKV